MIVIVTNKTNKIFQKKNNDVAFINVTFSWIYSTVAVESWSCTSEVKYNSWASSANKSWHLADQPKLFPA